jgi:hypothetical protein
MDGRRRGSSRPLVTVLATIIVSVVVIGAFALDGSGSQPGTPSAASRQAVLDWTQSYPQMWSWMQTHWSEMTLMHQHWGNASWMRQNLPDHIWMQAHWDDMTWMHDHWQSMSWMHEGGMMNGSSPGDMMGGS